VILTHPKTPLVFGTVMIGLLAVYLTLRHPSPGPLAAPHAEVANGAGLAACTTCHAHAGLAQGCLRCHVEIADQIQTDRGYHAFLLRGRDPTCEGCHPDHLGREFPLVSGLSWEQSDPALFEHSHVRFALEGAHQNLACDACHQRAASFSLPGFSSQPRRSTFLGLTQDCVGCHEDVHAGRLARACQLCHSQEAFRPAVQFRHDDYYVLEGPHARVGCSACHPVAASNNGPKSRVEDVNDVRVAFDKVKGTTCADCHQTPHRTRWPGDCTACHLAADETWAKGIRGIQPQTHALTGFPLDEAHATVACEKCHPTEKGYGQRYPDPNAAGYARQPKMCEGCHADPHGGQFRSRYPNCADCHAAAQFKPAQFDVTRHADTYPLRGFHADVACVKCHPADPNTGVRRFTSVPHQCDACHVDPHKGQFLARHAQCTDCHGEERFVPARYGVTTHAAIYPLTGAHAAVPCLRCHPLAEGSPVRPFASTARECKQCHADPHGGQFQREMAKGDCTACHRQDAATFTIRPYDHARQTGYSLTGAHEEAQCADCHWEPRGGTPYGSLRWARVYRGTPVACDACHADAHRGQFKQDGKQDCRRCHVSTENWTVDRFDHNRDARFRLEGAHATVACSSCHPSVRQGDGQNVVQYRPLGIHCEDCHAFTPK